MLSVELQGLKNRSHPGPNKGSKPSSIWFFNTIFPNYTQALAEATTWFMIITERNSRNRVKEEDLPKRNGKVIFPWIVEGEKLKNNPGKVVLRPWGASPASQAKPEPKLDFQPDEDGKYAWDIDPKTGKVPKGEFISEIIFEVDDDSDKHGNCPIFLPAKEPEFDPSKQIQSQPIKVSQPQYPPEPRRERERRPGLTAQDVLNVVGTVAVTTAAVIAAGVRGLFGSQTH